MRKLTGFTLVLAMLGTSAGAQDAIVPATDNFCITNSTEDQMLFITETREGMRSTANLNPGAQLCSGKTAAADGIVSVFQNTNHMEGCSRIIKTGTVENLLEYAEFDRCLWQSNTP